MRTSWKHPFPTLLPLEPFHGPPLGLMRTNWKQKEAVQNIIVLPLLIRKYIAILFDLCIKNLAAFREQATGNRQQA